MIEYKLRYLPKLSRQQARDKIVAHARFGKHPHRFRPKDGRELDVYLLQRYVQPAELIEECRDPNRSIPEFENAIRSTWSTDGGWSLAEKDGTTVTEMEGPGLLIWSTYEAHFEAACAARDRSVEGSSVQALYECLSQGIVSIEAFLNAVAFAWNKRNPLQKLVDSEKTKVSLETKLTEWIPIITSGRKVEKNNRCWSDFKMLKSIRDDNAIHPKLPGQSITYIKLAKYLNSFRFGVALFLGNLHLHVGRAVPSVIINAVYQPDVEVCKMMTKGQQ